jgi:hypothetical protein
MGAFNDISSIDRNDITLWLDMSPYDETVTGTVKVRARVLIDSVNSSSVLDIGTYDINVTFHN